MRTEIRGVDELKAKLARDYAGKAIRRILKDAIGVARTEARGILHGRGTGLAERTIRTSTRALTARAYSMMSEARQTSMHEGRSPGTRISLEQAARWALGRPYLTRRRMADLTPGERRTAIEARNAIEQGGAKAIPYWPQARAAVAEALPGILDAAAKRMETEYKA